MATTDTQLQQLVINVGTDAQIKAGIASGTITEDMLSIATDGADITYDWIGTLAEYNDQDIKTQHPDWLCFITDDVNNAGEDIYNNVYSKTEADETFVSKVDNLPQYLPNLLEYKYTDHILNNVSWLRADTFSWQSGEIYEAAYEHLMEDMLNATQKSTYLNHNVTLIGDATVSNRGILGGFRTTVSYAQVSGLYTPTTSLEVVIKVRTPSSYSNSSIIEPSAEYKGMVIRFTSATNIKVWLSSNGTSWNVMSSKDHTCTAPVESLRWVKLTWDGATYTLWISDDGINYTSIGTQASTDPIYWNDHIMNLGGAGHESDPFTYGTIDLSESYVKIDGIYAWKGTNSLTYYEAEDGHKICLPDQENNVDYLYGKGDGWYYIYDAENNRFKLPRNKHRKVVESGVERGIWYRLYDDGWVEQGGILRGLSGWANITIFFPIPMADRDYSYSQSPIMNTSNGEGSWAVGVTLKTETQLTSRYHANNGYTPSWMIQGQSAVKPRTKGGEDYLYFYVGEFTQDAIRNIAGITTEALNEKIDRGEHEVIEFQTPNSNNNYTWYRKYADGWVEQGGICTSYNYQTIILPITMVDKNYNVQLTPRRTSTTQAGDANDQVLFNNCTANSIYVYINNTANNGVFWQVNGMAA